MDPIVNNPLIACLKVAEKVNLKSPHHKGRSVNLCSDGC